MNLIKRPVRVLNPNRSKTKKEESKQVSESKLSYEAQKEQNRIQKRIEKQITESEKLISELEQKIADLEIQLSTPEGSSNPDLFQQYDAIKKQLSAEMENWEKLTLQLKSNM